MKKFFQKDAEKKKGIYHTFLELVAVGSLTGVIAGTVVTAFNILVHEGESISRDIYGYVRANPWFIPLLLMALVSGGILLGVAVNIWRRLQCTPLTAVMVERGFPVSFSKKRFCST